MMEVRRQELEEMYLRNIEEAREFMADLFQTRIERDNYYLWKTRKMIGPPWYQVLSPKQRESLDALPEAIHQDVIEERACRTQRLITELGLFPVPSMNDLMTCIMYGEQDSVQFIVELFKFIYNHPVSSRRECYPINARLLLSSLCYLGLEELIKILTKIFYVKPKTPELPEQSKVKKQTKLVSPYLRREMVVFPRERRRISCYETPEEVEARLAVEKKCSKSALKVRISNSNLVRDTGFGKSTPKNHRSVQSECDETKSTNKEKENKPSEKKLLPIPSFSNLTTIALEEELVRAKPPTPPSPPPPAKKRIPTRLCDQIAGIYPLNLSDDIITMTVQKTNETKITKRKGFRMKETKKSYGITMDSKKRKRGRRIPIPPTQCSNAKYYIGGVTIVNGHAVFIINGITTDPGNNYIINLGIVLVDGMLTTNHGGLSAINRPEKSPSCNCLKFYAQTLEHLEETKCQCGHHYDFYHQDGPIDPLNPVYFHPPTLYHPFTFDHSKIFELDEKTQFVNYVFNELANQESLLAMEIKPDRKILQKLDKVKKVEKFKEKAIEQSKEKTIEIPKEKITEKPKDKGDICLSGQLSPAEYLKSVLATLRHRYVLASLPDVHLVPELLEWMRFRVNGPVTPKQKAKYLANTKLYFDFYQNLCLKNWGHPSMPKNFNTAQVTTWLHKDKLTKNFAVLIQKYRRKFYKASANQYNLLWPIMYQDVFPNKSFRQVFFSYFGSRQEQYHILHPYDRVETMARQMAIRKGRISCITPMVKDGQ